MTEVAGDYGCWSWNFSRLAETRIAQKTTKSSHGNWHASRRIKHVEPPMATEETRYLMVQQELTSKQKQLRSEVAPVCLTVLMESFD